MISRLLRRHSPEAEAAPEDVQERAPASSGSDIPNTAPQEPPDASSDTPAPQDQPLRHESDQTASNASGTADNPQPQRNESSSTRPTASDEPVQAGTLDEQAAMLCRLTSIATAATAASLIHNQPRSSTSMPGDSAGQPDAPSAVNPVVPGAATGSAPVQPRFPDPTAVLRIPASLLRATHRIGRLAMSPLHRARNFRAANGPSFDPAMSDSGINPSQDDRFNEEDAASVDQSLGPGVLIRPSGFVDSNAELRGHGSGNAARNSDQAQSQGLSPDTTANNEGMTLSEMIHEAIRAHAATEQRQQQQQEDEEEAAVVNNTSTTQPPTSPFGTADAPIPQTTQRPSNAQADPPLPLHRHLAQVLQMVRENRLDDSGIEGSFERWLSDLGGELQCAVRAMADANGIVASRNETAPQSQQPRESTSAGAGAGAGAGETQDRTPRSTDVSGGQLRFYRIFRFPADAHRRDIEDPDALASRPAAGLIPCVIVAVNSNPVDIGLGRATPVNVNAGRDTTNVGEDFASTRATDASNPSPATDAAAPPSSGENAEAQSPPSNQERWHTSRFNMFVSGGHFPPTHPLLVSPHAVAARDVMDFMRILAAHSALNNPDALRQRETSPVTSAELASCDLEVKKWTEIKEVSVSADAHTETVVKDATSESSATAKSPKAVPALRAGDHCNICLEEWADSDSCRILGCRHVYHQGCVDEWLTKSSNSCPMCRTVAVKRSTSRAGA